MVVFNTLNWADVEEITEVNWFQIHQDLECCLLVFFEVMMAVNPQTSSLVLLAI